MSFPDFTVPLTQIKKPLLELQADIETRSILADDRGAVGDGTTNDASSIQDAIDELGDAGGGQLILSPYKSYLSSVLYLKPNVLINLNRATMIAKQSSDNQLFAFGVGIAGQTPISLSSALQGGTSITVSSSSTFVIGERILISAGTFTGSGVEEGPIEYNTVLTKPDATHITVVTPLKYSYSAFGLPGASGPGIRRIETFTRGLIHDVRITNGKLRTKSGDTPLYFNGSGERIEIDHLYMDGVGSNIMTGGYISALRFHDNIYRGVRNTSGGGINQASLVESFIEDNIFAGADDNGSDSINGLQLEVTCRDNVIARNRFGPKKATSSAAIEFSYYGFNNIIAENSIFGNPSDVSAGTATLGIRTYANSASPPSGLGNVIIGNRIHDMLLGIGDTLEGSIISGNAIITTGSHANTEGIIMNTAKGTLGPNTIIGYTKPVSNGAGSTPISQMRIGSVSVFHGTGSPETVVTAPVGASYFRTDGGLGTALYIKESGTGNTGWVAYGGVGTFQPLDSDLTTIAGLTATTDNIIQSVGSAWASRTPAQVKTALGLTVGTNVQAWDADLDAIAALSPSNDDIVQRKSGAWTNRTMAQLAADLTTLAPKASPSFTGVVSSAGAVEISGGGGSAGANKGVFSESGGNISITAYGADNSTPGAFLMGCLSANGSAGDFFMYLSKVGVLKLGTSGANTVRGTTEGTQHLDIFNGTAPVGTLSNGISLYTTSGELRVMDSGGTATLLSQHSADAPASLYDDDDTPQRVSHEYNVFSGKVRFVNLTRAARLQQSLFMGEALPKDLNKRRTIHEETFDEYNKRLGLTPADPKYLVIADWDTDQENHFKNREQERAEWDEMVKTSGPGARFITRTKPEKYQKLPRPGWLKVK